MLNYYIKYEYEHLSLQEAWNSLEINLECIHGRHASFVHAFQNERGFEPLNNFTGHRYYIKFNSMKYS